MKCFVCSKCNKDFWGEHPGYFVVFDKCQGKFCPDCGKVRKLGRVKCIHWEKSELSCINCNKSSEVILNGVCKDCFLRNQKDCICPFKKWGIRGEGYIYYCSLCEELHDSSGAICKECAKKQDVSAEQQRVFWRVVLPSAAVGMIIGFFLGWLFLIKLRKKKPNK